jgi:hypothetical protein
MGKKYQITEEQFSNLMRNLTEIAAGYDDFFVMSQHAGKSMEQFLNLLNDLMSTLGALKMVLKDDDVSINDVEDYSEEVFDVIGNMSQTMKRLFRDFTEKELILKGKILMRKLESFTEKMRTVLHYKEETFNDKDAKKNITNFINGLRKYLEDYIEELRTTHERFGSRIQKNKPKYD